MAASSSSSELPPQHQVFINFRGEDLRYGFVSHLVPALENHNINVFYDKYEDRGEHLNSLLKRIEESRIALTIFSMKYTDSDWCLRELAKINDCMKEDKLVAIPVFYKVEPSTVKGVRGQFGDAFRDLVAKGYKKEEEEWRKALEAIPEHMGITVFEKSVESEKINEIVEAVKKVLTKIPSERRQDAFVDPSENNDIETSSGGEKDKLSEMNDD